MQSTIEQESQFSDISVYVQCSELDCCEEDNICSNVKICDTDGDGDYDTIEGVNNEDGVTHLNLNLNPIILILFAIGLLLAD